MLYRIEGTGIKIAGTMSAVPPEQTPVPRWLQHVFDASDRVVFAADTGQIDPAVLLLPAHQSLTVLSFFDAVAALWRRLEIPGHPARFKPWVVSARLRAHLAGLLAPGAEPSLIADAGRRPVPPEFLDTPQEWVAAFDAVPLEEQLDGLERVVTSPEEATSLETLVHEAWASHNLKAMDAPLQARRQAQPSFYQHCIDGRNRRWLPALTRFIGEDATARRRSNTLVVVEAWHLCGPQGLISLLTHEGRTLTQLL